MRPDKELFKQVRQAAKGAGIEALEVRPQILRVYAKLSNTSHSAQFDFRDVTTVIKKVEKTLGKNDMFFGNGQMAIGLQKFIDDKPGNQPIYFYGDRMWFAGGAPATSTAATATTPANIVLPEFSAVELLYNSALSFKTDSKIRLEGFDTAVFRCVPETQNSATQVSSGEIHFVDLGVKYVIQGGVENTAEILFDGIGDKTNIGGVLGQNYAVILMPGYIVRGGANNTKFVSWSLAAQNGDI